MVKIVCAHILALPLLAIGIAGSSHAALVQWAGSTQPSLTGISGPPDGAIVAGLPATITSFQPAVSYPGLATLLGVSQATLARADAIAFEFNGGSPAPSGGWESSRWRFTDGVHSLTVDFIELVGAPVPAEVVGNGSVSAAAYNLFFNVQTPRSDTVMSYLLFDLPDAIDIDSSAFSIMLTSGAAAGLPGAGTPDPDAIGLLRHVPEPGTITLMLAGLCLWWGTRKLRVTSEPKYGRG